MSLKEKLNLEQDPIFLIDGSAFIYRGFYAFRNMSRSDGAPSNALYFILRLMLRILREEKPKHIAFILDGKGKNFRNDLYGAYKAQRQATPEDLIAQIEPIKEALKKLGVAVYVSEGCEADDCIASMALRHRDEHPVVIVGADKDLKQCLDEKVWLWDPSGKAEKLTTREDFEKETGMKPEHWPDFQAIIGDSSDNIPGVPGVGPKTAQKIMEKFRTLEDLWDNFEAIEPKFRKKLDGHRDDTFTFRELTRLKTDACPELDLEAIRLRRPDLKELRDYLQEWEFRTLLRELPKPEEMPAEAPAKAPKEAAGKAAPGGQTQLSLFGTPAPRPKADALEVTQISSADELPKLAGVRVGLVPHGGKWRLGVDGAEFEFSGSAAELAKALKAADSVAAPSFKELLSGDGVWGEVALEKWLDLSLAAYLLNPEERNYGWARLRQLYEHDPDVEPAHPDAEGLVARSIGDGLAKKIEAAGMHDLMADLEMPLIPVLVGMERAGLKIDTEAFAEFLDDVTRQIEKKTRAIYSMAGEEFNIRSSQQLAEVLFTRMGLKAKGKTPGGAPSTSSQVLEKLAGDHDIIQEILDFRMLEKLRSTYLAPLPGLADGKGRIHTTLNNLATATGRLSSSNPNLQNIPIRGVMGKRMRACFDAAEGNLMAAADYSQIELRLLAHFSGDEALLAAFRHGEDIHARTAAVLFGKEPSEVAPDERRNAKTINFGLLYGMGPQRLARELRITMNEAKEFIARYFERMPRIRQFYEQVEEEARRQGYVTTVSGRRRWLPDINSRNNNLQSQARRQAINTRVQGSAADIIKMAMIACDHDEELKRLGATLVLQVHDELILEAPEANAHAAGKRMQQIMSNIMQLDVPLSVDLGVGKNWAEAH